MVRNLVAAAISGDVCLPQRKTQVFLVMIHIWCDRTLNFMQILSPVSHELTGEKERYIIFLLNKTFNI
jgi:hypothetical protein